MKVDLQRAFPLEVLMIPSSALAVAIDDERLTLFALGILSSSLTTSAAFASLPGGVTQAPTSWD
jgi:hypothetical protein